MFSQAWNCSTWQALPWSEETTNVLYLTKLAMNQPLSPSMVTKEFSCECPSLMISVLHAVGPVIVMAPVHINVTSVEDDIVLRCSATGFPTPIITWQHNGSLVTEMGRVEINETTSYYQRNSILTIRTAMTNDTGNYSCIASVASYSQISEVVLVLVQGE